MKKSKLRNISGPYIRHYRKACSPPVSQKELSHRIAKHGVIIAQAEFSRIENQRIGITDLQIAAIAKCLKVSIGQLCGEPPVIFSKPA